MDLTDKQKMAILLGAKIGDEIRVRHPEIADHYRKGMTARVIEATYGFAERYGVGRRIAVQAVRNAMRGYSGTFYPMYDGLITDKTECARLALEHDTQSAMDSYRARKGIHGLDREAKIAYGRKGGLIAGPLTYRLKLGCHAMSAEALAVHCRKISPLGAARGGIASVLSRHLIPFTKATAGRLSELDFAASLAEDPTYLGPIRANFKKIADFLNQQYYAGKPVLNRVSLKLAMQHYARERMQRKITTATPDLMQAYCLMQQQEFQLPAHIRAEKIALKVNEVYHGGRPVRTAMTIRKALQRHKLDREANI